MKYVLEQLLIARTAAVSAAADRRHGQVECRRRSVGEPKDHTGNSLFSTNRERLMFTKKFKRILILLFIFSQNGPKHLIVLNVYRSNWQSWEIQSLF